MNKNIILSAENISKQYRLGLIGTGTLKEDLNRWWCNIRGKEDPYLKVGEANDRSIKSQSEYVWALKDINFQVEKGEVLGIIGKNGAGKSTLLKLLSRVTAPTTGTIKSGGRIASLLEVGTGFHPELTGRENIFLNGAILGMTKNEIKRKLDEIIHFSGVARYIDTPVKRYSSGMRVRLGFAVAAFLDPEILVIDEVLAVGDAEFQKKAIGKMQDVSKEEGKTVLFVSHNMQSVSSLTQRCLVLDRGMISFNGPTNEAINSYLAIGTSSSKYVSSKSKNEAHLMKAEVKTSHEGGIHNVGEQLQISFKLFTPRSIDSAAFSYQIVNSKGVKVLDVLNLKEEIDFCQVPGEYGLTSTFKQCRLYPDRYHLTVHFADRKSKMKFETISEICSFEVKKLGELREFYWYPGNAIYLDENKWDIELINKF